VRGGRKSERLRRAEAAAALDGRANADGEETDEAEAEGTVVRRTSDAAAEAAAAVAEAKRRAIIDVVAVGATGFGPGGGRGDVFVVEG